VDFIFSTPLHNLDEQFWREFGLELLHYLMALSVFKIMNLWCPVVRSSDTVSGAGVTWIVLGLNPSFFGVATIINRIALSVFR